MAKKNNNNNNKPKNHTGSYKRPRIPNNMGNKRDRRDEEIIDTASKGLNDVQERRTRGSKVTSRNNDVSWYESKFPQFAKDAANLSFAQILGSNIELMDPAKYNPSTGGWTVQEGREDFVLPGLMSLPFYMVPGVSSDFTSPINRSSIKYWTYLRSIQKASGPYDHQDVTMMIWAISSCIAFHSLMRRVYGVINNFTPVNNYYPQAIVAASGFDWTDIRTNIQDFRAYINTFAFNLGQYPIPKDITLLDRYQWMSEGLYVDGQTTKAQTYMFVPQGFWKYNNLAETGGQLEYTDWLGTLESPTTHTFAEVKAFGDALINAISNEQDFAFIAGDMHAMYADNVYQLPYVDEQYVVYPAYNATVLSQIENCTIAGYFADPSSTVISQENTVNQGALIFNPKFERFASDPTSTRVHAQDINEVMHKFINMHVDNPTPDDVLEATRLMIDENYNEGLLACGTEIVCRVCVWYRNPLTYALRYIETRSNTLLQNASSIGEPFDETLDYIAAAFSQFDWSPILNFWHNAGVSTEYPNGIVRPMGWVGDIANFTVLPTKYLDQIHTAVLYNLFNI